MRYQINLIASPRQERIRPGRMNENKGEILERDNEEVEGARFGNAQRTEK